MRTSPFASTRSPTPWRVLVSTLRVAGRAGLVAGLVAGFGAAGSACESRGELREWQPTDHQPPPAVAPEGQAAGSQETGDPNARAAASLWSMRCASCHGESGRGDGTARPPGAQVPDLTTAAYKNKRSDAELHAIIKGGRNMMPAFGDQLTDLGIDALIKHVRTLAAAP